MPNEWFTTTNSATFEVDSNGLYGFYSFGDASQEEEEEQKYTEDDFFELMREGVDELFLSHEENICKREFNKAVECPIKNISCSRCPFVINSLEELIKIMPILPKETTFLMNFSYRLKKIITYSIRRIRNKRNILPTRHENVYEQAIEYFENFTNFELINKIFEYFKNYDFGEKNDSRRNELFSYTIF